MDCRETQTLLTAFHDGELPAADRARVEGHLRGCPACGALLAGLARVDRAAGVPDPGPAYWDRFNARVTDRIEREADGPGAAVLRPKGGWMRQQLRYLVPAAAAAVLVVMVVRYGGMDSGAPAPAGRQAVSEPAAPPESRGAIKAESAAPARRVPPPVLPDERADTGRREGRVPLAAPSVPAGKEEASRNRSAAAPAVGAPSPPQRTFRGAPTGSPPAPAADAHETPGAEAGGDTPGPVAPPNAMPRGVQAERKKMAGAAALTSEQDAAGEAKPASVAGIVKEPAAGSPCELARTLAERERIRDAETAQRACLARDLDAPTREKGLVFLAELLDRQARFSEADAVIAEVDRRFPQSRPLDLYRQQRPMVQKQPKAVPVTR